METITVGLGDRSYPIYIGTGLDTGALVKEALPKAPRLMVVSNTTVFPLYGDKVVKSLEEAGFKVSSCILKDGEAYKTHESWWQIETALLDNDFGRDGAVIALGGGVVGDMAGFAAATFQRGIPFVQIPTTLLAMVDSSVGGKTAINHPLGKNMIGAFHQPGAVIADLSRLKTLPRREIACGMGEVVKTGIIYDAEFFKYLEKDGDKAFLHDHYALAKIIGRCCEVKADVVSQDEKEHGLRAILNLGHTFGHAVEASLGFGTWLHGEAVGLGTVIAAYLSFKRSLISKSDYERIRAVVGRCQLPVKIPDSMGPEDFIEHMHHDKKVRAGSIRYVLPTAVGRAQVFSDVSDDEVRALIAEFKEL